MKASFIIIFSLLLLIAITAIFLYRYQILQYSAETIIRKVLPDYIKIDNIKFDPKDSRIIFERFKILNPDGYSNSYLLEISEAACRYKMMGKSLLEGMEIFEPSFKMPILN